jgi:hypothetical protein
MKRLVTYEDAINWLTEQDPGDYPIEDYQTCEDETLMKEIEGIYVIAHLFSVDQNKLCLDLRAAFKKVMSV